MTLFIPQLSRDLSIGACVEFRYPTDNRIRVSTRLHTRSFVIRSIRDLEARPLESVTLQIRPDVRRSRYLLTGHDLDCHDRRSFYTGSIRSAKRLDVSLFRLALVDPITEQPVNYSDTIYAGTRSDLALARATIKRFYWLAKTRPKVTHNLVLVPFEASQ